MPSKHRQRSAQRGSALLLVVVLIGVLTIIGLAIVSNASRDGEETSAKRNYDQTVNCADAAREMLLSQFRAYGAHPTSLTLNTTTGDQKLASGHYENIAIQSVVPAKGASTTTFGLSDISNRIARVGMGGQVYRMTVVCEGAAPPGGGKPRAVEVEYLVRFGL